MLRRLIIFSFIAYFVLISKQLDALDPNKEFTQYKFSIWNQENGLPQISVLAIMQSSDGYLWLGTLGGLVRFDGINFKVYNRENTFELKDNTITTLYETSDGVMILGTAEDGLVKYHNERFERITHNLPGNLKQVSAIFEDLQKRLWIGTMDIGLICKSRNSYKIFSVNDGLPHNRIRSISQDSHGTIWVSTDNGLLKISKTGEIAVKRPAIPPLDSFPTAICYNKGEMWAGSHNGVVCIDISSRTPNIVKKYNFKHTARCISIDRDQNRWIGTDGGGLIRIKEGRIEKFTISHGLASNFINAIYEDRQGNIWLGSLDGGLQQFKDTDTSIISMKEGLTHNVISKIIQDRAGNIWVGTKGGGVNRLKKNKVELVLDSRNSLKDDNIHSLLEDSNGVIWIGTDSGLYSFQNELIKQFTIKDGLGSNQIYLVLEDQTKRLWIITKENINIFQNGKFSEFTPPDELAQKKIQYIYKSNNGRFWFLIQNGGICAVDGDQTILYDESNGLVQNEVESMYEDRDGVLYFGTRGGMSRIEKGKITNYTTDSGLVENQVRHVMEDRLGYLWLSGRLGIYRISKREVDDYAAGLVDRVHPMTFDQSDGIEQPWCESGIVTRDGKLWFTSYKGLVIIDPAKVGAHTSVPPRAIVEAMNVNGSPMDIYPEDGELMLPPGKKRVEFVYTAPTFYKPKKVKFHLKLNGYEKEWVEVGTNRSTVYTGLGPGRYTFEVAASNPQGAWNKDTATLSFYIKPYFYQTMWFILSMGIALVILTVFSYKLRTRQLRNREKVLSSLVESRTRELRESNAMIEAKNRQLQSQSEKLKEMDQIKSRFFANISHEFRTPLTLIMGPLERRLFESRNQGDVEELEMMLRNSRRLLSLINQLLDLAKLESGGMRLLASNQDIVPFAKGIARSFDSLLSRQKLTLDMEVERESILLYFDGEKIEKVISNLLSNAIKFTPTGGTITFKLSLEEPVKGAYPEGSVALSVKDTGPGIPKDQLPYIFNHFYQAEGVFSYNQASKGSGIGLALVKELVVLHSGDIAVDSQRRKGTEFILRLPLGRRHLKPEEIVEAISEPPVETEINTQDIDEAIEQPEPFGAGDSNKDLILVVEDNADVRLYIRKAIEPYYRVEEAVNGKAGMQQARASIPDLIISDVMMPLANGYELCRTLKTDVKTSHIPIILLTAKAAEENVVEGLETGADDYVVKPFNTRILLSRVKNLIQLRRQLQQNIQQDLILKPEEIAVSSVDQTFIKELKQVLEHNIADADFGVDDLADAMFMSRATLNRKLKAISGESTNRFIQSFRLKRALQLLKENYGNVTEVAFAVGFSSSAYFTRCFKDKFNQLPHQFNAAN
jgi:signal transduction histidine kinase/ligand-binding sensor domain-containing protein/DNA-binding response OmpR family regulator